VCLFKNLFGYADKVVGKSYNSYPRHGVRNWGQSGLILKIEVACFSEKLVSTYSTGLYHDQEDLYMNNSRCGNVKKTY
jgi:hypothetical protein